VSAPPLSNQNQHQEETIPPVVKPNQGQESSIPPTFPGAQGSTHEVPLPEVFRGCWQGTVPRVDSIVPIDPMAGRTIWLTKAYTLCYKQTGVNGPWVLTYAEGAVANRSEVSDQRQAIKVKSVTGADRAEITAYLHFRAPSVSLFGPGRMNTLDELSHLHCYVMPDQQVMDVRALVFIEQNGRPSVNITWHTRFYRTTAARGN
jgi:hypothetical protein